MARRWRDPAPALRAQLAAGLREGAAHYKAHYLRAIGTYPEPNPMGCEKVADALDRGEAVEVAGWEIATHCDDHPRWIALVSRVRVERDGTLVAVERRPD